MTDLRNLIDRQAAKASGGTGGKGGSAKDAAGEAGSGSGPGPTSEAEPKRSPRKVVDPEALARVRGAMMGALEEEAEVRPRRRLRAPLYDVLETPEDQAPLPASADPEAGPSGPLGGLRAAMREDGQDESHSAEGASPPHLAQAAPHERRPSRLRSLGLLHLIANQLCIAGVSANQVSQMSMTFAALGAVCLWATPQMGGVLPGLLFFLAALCVLLRMLCNLLDGIIALDIGQSEPTGRFWNETSDRVSDMLLLTGAGFAAGQAWLGFTCGFFALASAWLREMSRAEGFGEDFGGPFARSHRMAFLALACLVAAILPGLVGTAFGPMLLMSGVMVVLTLGTMLTVLLRGRRILDGMNTRG